MNIIDVNGITKSFGARTILDNVTFTIDETEKIGLIGVNGSGKSTLFQVLAGTEDPDSGAVIRKRGGTAGYLSQEPDLDEDATVAQEIEKGLRHIRTILTEYAEVTARLAESSSDNRLLARQGELSTWIEHHGGWNTDHRVAEIMAHLNLPDPEQKISELSGGTKRRTALARLLLEAPDLLLLDEPTNHLDADATEWLQEYLLRYKGAVFLITHDRYFLDRVTSRILELDKGIVTSYPGSYSRYLELKAEKLEQAAQSQSRLLNLLRVETAWIRRGAKARSTKQKARIGRYDDLVERTSTAAEREMSFQFGQGEQLGGIVVEMEGVTKSFGGPPLVKGLTLSMKRGERLGIIGPNGSGKSTLVKMIMGEETPDAGTVRIGKKASIAYFDQHRQVDDPSQSIYDFLGEGDYVSIGGAKRHKIGYMEEFLFHPSDRVRPISTLSGGERGRLLLAKLMLKDANILILDEPTNDLDIPTLQILDDALSGFKGCIIMVTHDRFFLDKTATAILSFEGEGKVVRYEGNYSLYRELKSQTAVTLQKERREPSPAKIEEPRQKKGLTYAERIELEKVEKEIGELEPKKAELESMLCDPGRYEATEGGIERISREFAECDEHLAGLYARWEELELKKES